MNAKVVIHKDGSWGLVVKALITTHEDGSQMLMCRCGDEFTSHADFAEHYILNHVDERS
jgi:uncharacterized C2H2 Zn-finger protein